MQRLEITESVSIVTGTKLLPGWVVNVIRNESDAAVTHENGNAASVLASGTDQRGSVRCTSRAVSSTVRVLRIRRQQHVERSLFVDTYVPELAGFCSLVIGAACAA